MLTALAFFVFSPQSAKGQIIVIEEGAFYTNKTTVKLFISCFHADSVKIWENKDFEKAKWQPYKNTFNWHLAYGDGVHHVFALFKRKDGSLTHVVNDEIYLDTDKPKNCEVKITNGTYSSTQGDILLKLKADGADFVRVSNSKDFTGAHWHTMRGILRWTLTSGDGRKVVYAQFMDKANNLSEVVHDKVILDTEPPKNGSIEIGSMFLVKGLVSEKKYINKRNAIAQLKIHADGAKYMMISNSPTFYKEKWRYYLKQFPNWSLRDKTDGVYKVYVKFKDKAQNESPVYSDEVIVDTESPLGSKLAINSGSHITNNPNVILHPSSKGAVEMRISNFSDLENVKWEKYVLEKKWELDKREGLNHVYIQFRDEAHNATEVVSSNIYFDQTPPSNGAITINDGNENTFNPKVMFRAHADGKPELMQISEDSSFSNAFWRAYITKPLEIKLSPKGGIKRLYARFKDAAGNISKTVSDDILLEIKPSGLKFEILENVFCTDPEGKVRLHLRAADASSMKISNSPSFANANWEPYKRYKDWRLTDNDGVQKVYAIFKSFTETESNVVSDQIILDRKPPYDTQLLLSREGLQDWRNAFEIKVIALAKDAELVQIDETPKFWHKRWIPYSDLGIIYKLHTDGYGEKTIYVRFKDKAGNISKPISESVVISKDIKPEGYVLVNKGVASTSKKSILLHLEDKMFSQFRIGNYPDLNKVLWQELDSTFWWNITGDDGVKTFYIQFKGDSSKTSKVFSYQAILDTHPPEFPDISFKEGKYCTRPDGLVNLELHAIGASKMKISNKPDLSDAKWELYKNSKKWYLDSLEGHKKVYVVFGDVAGNVTEPIFGRVNLDYTSPQIDSVAINKNSNLANSSNIDVSLFAEGADQMIVSNNGYFGHPAKWIPFEDNFSWKYTGYDGKSSVYIKLKDRAGNESTIYKKNFVLDTEPPIVHSIILNNGKTAVDGTYVTILSKVSGASLMKIANNSDFSSTSWQPFVEKTPWDMSEKGLQRVYLKFRDSAGNESNVFNGEIMVY